MSAAMPVISVAFDMDEGAHVIYAASYGQVMPAGPRLFRAPPHPAVRWSHEDAASAERDAATLRAYLDGLGARKGPSKAALRKQGAE